MKEIYGTMDIAKSVNLNGNLFSSNEFTAAPVVEDILFSKNYYKYNCNIKDAKLC